MAMEVVSHQLFDLCNGMPKFKHVKALLRKDETYFTGKSMTRTSSDEVILQTLQDVTPIPAGACQPKYVTGITIAPADPAFFVKRPTLIDYNGGSDISTRILREVTVCEALKRHEHPNIAQYAGCLVSNGHIEGICFSEYAASLMSKLNPHHNNKTESARKCSLSPETIDRYVSGLDKGVRHLHSLGFVHNDINPSNIMLTNDDSPVIIDFDSCTKVGDTMEGVRRTHGWYDRDILTAAVSNDLDAVEEVRKWLAGDCDNFKFQE